jgi:3-(methylthio)propanoyl-CoA dehydrogenase
MLLSCKAQIEAMRALAYVSAASLDLAAKHPDEAVRKEHRAFVELMIPVVKGWCTETAQEVCSTALQVFGGMGYVEETGIAQQYRDVRITSIYEGTTGIQALDLIGRKLIRDMGASATKVLKQIGASAKELGASANPQVAALAEPLADAVKGLGETAQWIGMNAMGDLRTAFACSVPFLRYFGIVAGAWQLFRGAKIAAEKLAAGETDEFYAAKITTATFYAHHILTQGAWLRKQITEGAADVMAGSDEIFEVDRRSLQTA